MSTTLNTTGLPVGIVCGDLEFCVEWGPDETDVLITFEEGCSGYDGCGIRERTITISREDWEAIVAHVALPRFEHREAVEEDSNDA